MYRGEFEVGSTKFTLDIEDTSGTFAWDFPAMVEVDIYHIFRSFFFLFLHFFCLGQSGSRGRRPPRILRRGSGELRTGDSRP